MDPNIEKFQQTIIGMLFKLNMPLDKKKIDDAIKGIIQDDDPAPPAVDLPQPGC